METIGPTALVVGILYVLSRWALSALDYAAAYPGKGRPEVTWQITWWIAMIVSLLGAASAHLWLLGEAPPDDKVQAFNAIVFGGFLIGFGSAGHLDHKVRLGLRGDGS